MAKLAKSDVEFESPAKGPHHCGECRHFEPPDACEIVAGAIGADDWCNRFVGKVSRIRYKKPMR